MRNILYVITTSTLSLGSHYIAADYSGDSAYNSSAASMTQTVAPAFTSIAISSNANPAQPGQLLTFTATVAAAGMGTGTPTGSVVFYDGSPMLGSGTLTLVNGREQAMFTTAALGLGAHTILAIYSGDSAFADSGSSLQETIN